MRIVLVRHAIAENRDVFAESGKPEANRPLTDKGARRMRRGARGLRRIVRELDCVATSPLLRARETAELVANSYDKKARPRIEVVRALSPGSGVGSVVDWLRAQDPEWTVALVGHEPDLSLLLTYLTTGGKSDFARIGKGAACLIDCGQRPGPRGGELVWMLPPSILRRLGV